MRLRRISTGILLLPLLAGCAVTDLRPAAPSPALANAPAALPPPSTEDPATKPEAAGPLTLDDAIRRCLLADPQIHGAMQVVLQADADALAASLPPNPSLWTDLQLMPLTRPFTVTEQGGPPQQDVQLSYRIDWWLFGKRAAAMASAQLGQQVSQADLADLIRQRVLQCALAYHDLLEATAQMQLTKVALAEQEALAKPIPGAVAVGQLTPAEGKAFELALLKARQDVADAELARHVAQAKLATFLAQPTQPLTIITPMPAPPANVPWPTPDEAVQLALQQRPDLESLRQKIAQAHADCRVENTKAYPDVTPTVGYTRQYQTKAIGFPDANSWTVAVDISLPFCNRNEGARAKAVAVAAQAQCKLESAELELRAELTGLLAECAAALAAEANATRQVELAEEMVKALRATLTEINLKGAAELLVALGELQDARKSQVTRRATFWRAWWKLQAALGRQLAAGN